MTSKNVLFLGRLMYRHTGVSQLSSCFRSASCAAEGAVAPPVHSCVTAELAVRLWAQHFTLHGISEPLLSSQYIIAHVLGRKTFNGVDRRQLKDPLTDTQRVSVWKLCTKRLTSMPVQYVIGEWDFRDLTLKMKPPVFIPRPETEELVGLVLENLRLIRGESYGTDLRCLEVGCGSGAISLSLLHSIPQLKVFALDQSQAAVCLTMENANRLSLQDRLEVQQFDVMGDTDALLSKCGPVHFLVSNPPYLLTQEMQSLQREIVRFEDHAALDGGLDGLSVIRSLLVLASKLLIERGRVYLEVAQCHPPVIRQMIEETMPGLLYLETRCDLTNSTPHFAHMSYHRNQAEEKDLNDETQECHDSALYRREHDKNKGQRH